MQRSSHYAGSRIPPAVNDRPPAVHRGRRDFASRSQIVAARYDVVADAQVADEARNMLIKLGWREG